MVNKIIPCNWVSHEDSPKIRSAKLIDRSNSAEGIDVSRHDCDRGAVLTLAGADGHIFSLIEGSAILSSPFLNESLSIRSGMHIYIPPGLDAALSIQTDSVCINATAPRNQSRGTKLLIHDEQFLRSSRFVLTPQYLSRRAFLHRDETLLSRSGDPVSWFHTTMFDTSGLPQNEEGLEVFKMSYDYQSEINVVYETRGRSCVRFAKHPYGDGEQQLWSDWFDLDSEMTYYLNESADGDDVERKVCPKTGRNLQKRNKHEIFVEAGGYVSLCCMFDPAPTGVETHSPGEYTSYGPVTDVLNSDEYRSLLHRTGPDDEMIRTLSMAIARDPDRNLDDSPHWPVYMSALDQSIKEQGRLLSESAAQREHILQNWRTCR